jgi:hypothetical protein
MRRRARTLYLANNGEDYRGAEDVGSVVIGIGHVAPAEGVGLTRCEGAWASPEKPVLARIRSSGKSYA